MITSTQKTIISILTTFLVTTAIAFALHTWASPMPMLIPGASLTLAIIALQLPHRRFVTIALFLLVFLNVWNYSTLVFWGPFNLAHLRFPILIFALALMAFRYTGRIALLLSQNWDVLAFGAWACFSGLFARDVFSILYAGWLMATLLFILFFLKSFSSYRELLIKLAGILVLAYSWPVIMGIMALPQYRVGTRLVPLFDLDKVNGWGAMMVIVGLVQLQLLRKETDHWLLRMLASWPVTSVISTAAILNIILSGARAAMFGLLLTLIVYSTLLVSKRVQVRTGLARLGLSGLLVIGLLVFMGWRVFDFGALLEKRYEKIVLEWTEPYMNPRYFIWRSTLRSFRDNPITGAGLTNVRAFLPHYLRPIGQADKGFSSHGTHIEILAETGLVGIFFFAVILARSLFFASSISPGRSYTGHIALIVTGPLVISLFESNLTPGQALFYPLWLGILLPRCKIHRKQQRAF